MAGIGFNLQKILEGDSYFDSIKAHFYSALITAGPWILSILTLFLLNLFAPKNIDLFEMTYFRTAIVYIYAFSLIAVGFLHLSLSRYLADKLYIRDEEAMVPVFNSAAVCLWGVQALIGLVFFRTSEDPFLVKLLVVSIFLAIGLIWLVMIFLTALRDYNAITLAFLTGSAATIGAAWWLGGRYGLEGYLAGYLIGHLLIGILLAARIFIEFPSPRVFDADLFEFLKENQMLVGMGIIYNFAIWIDKIIFWVSPKAIEVSGFLRTYPPYESAGFFAYITIIPALSLFLLEVETNFYKRYRAFYVEIINKGSYAEIIRRRNDIAKTLERSIGLVVKYQGIISLLFITFAPEIASFFKMEWMQVPIFRVMVVAAFLHSLILIAVIIALYFDFKGLAMNICLIFFLTNGGFTWLTSSLPDPFVGYGYLLSAFLSIVYAFYGLDFKLKKLEYHTFAPQPVGIHRTEEVW